MIEVWLSAALLSLVAGADPAVRAEPMVAMLCPEPGDPAAQLFHNKFLSSGKWKTDTDMKATCRKDKVEIL